MRDDTYGPIPMELRSTYSMLECAFPDGIDDDSYLPLLAVLEQSMGYRGLARVVSLFTGKDYGNVLNDVYGITSTHIPLPDAVARVKERLGPCRYDEWLGEE